MNHLYDIHDRQPVLSPEEIEAGRLECERTNLQYITGLDGCAIPLATYIETLSKRWKRCAQTAMQIDAIKAGYCTIEAKGAPEPSRATH